MSKSHEDAYRFVSAMMRALAHTVRGDLSVVTNDLSYFSTLLPEGETDRSRTRCASVVANLSRLVLLQGDLAISEVSEEEMCRIVGVHEAPSDLSGSITVDTAKFSLIVQEVEKVLAGDDGSPCVRRYETAAAGEGRGLSVHCAVTTEAALGESLYTSLSQYAAARRGERYVVGAAAVDLVLLAHGWQSQVVERPVIEQGSGVVWRAVVNF